MNRQSLSSLLMFVAGAVATIELYPTLQPYIGGKIGVVSERTPLQKAWAGNKNARFVGTIPAMLADVAEANKSRITSPAQLEAYVGDAGATIAEAAGIDFWADARDGMQMIVDRLKPFEEKLDVDGWVAEMRKIATELQSTN